MLFCVLLQRRNSVGYWGKIYCLPQQKRFIYTFSNCYERNRSENVDIIIIRVATVLSKETFLTKHEPEFWWGDNNRACQINRRPSLTSLPSSLSLIPNKYCFTKPTIIKSRRFSARLLMQYLGLENSGSLETRMVASAVLGRCCCWRSTTNVNV